MVAFADTKITPPKDSKEAVEMTVFYAQGVSAAVKGAKRGIVIGSLFGPPGMLVGIFIGSYAGALAHAIKKGRSAEKS